MYNITIIDENPNFLANLTNKLKKYKCYRINTYENYDDFFKANHKIDILFTTNEFESKVNFDLFEKYSEINFLTVLIIKDCNSLHETYKRDMIWNFEKSDLNKAIPLINEKAEKYLSQYKTCRMTGENELKDVVNSKNIRFIYKDGNDLCIFADKEYRIRYSIKKFICDFDISNFIRISYSILLSPCIIKKINFTKRIVFLKNNQEFTITRGYLYNVYEKCYGNEQFDCIGGKKIKIKK